MSRPIPGKGHAMGGGGTGCILAHGGTTMMTISEYMTPFPHTIGPQQSLQEAHDRMNRHKIRHLPVIESGQLVGIVSQRDLYFLESLVEIDLTTVWVEEAMKDEVVTVAPETPIAEVARLMIDRQLGSVVIVDAEEIVGIFTSVDALALLFDLAKLGDQLIESETNQIPIQ